MRGFVLVQLKIDGAHDSGSLPRTVQHALNVDARFLSMKGGTVLLLAPTDASVSKIERELKRQKEIGPGAETLAAVNSIKRQLFEQGLRAAVSIEAAGAGTNGQVKHMRR